MFVTITGFKFYYGLKPFEIGRKFECIKEVDNPYDKEAIRVELPIIGTVGYIANSPNTRANGTHSAGRIYDKVPKKFKVRVLFTTFTKVICEVL